MLQRLLRLLGLAAVFASLTLVCNRPPAYAGYRVAPPSHRLDTHAQAVQTPSLSTRQVTTSTTAALRRSRSSFSITKGGIR